MKHVGDCAAACFVGLEPDDTFDLVGWVMTNKLVLSSLDLLLVSDVAKVVEEMFLVHVQQMTY